MMENRVSSVIRKNVIDKYFVANNLMEAMSSVTWMSRYMGVIPFNYYVDKYKRKTFITPLNLIYFAMVKIWYSLCVVLYMVYEKSKNLDESRNSLFYFAELICTYIGFTSVVFLTIDTFINMDDLSKIFGVLHDIDELYKSLGCPKKHFNCIRFKFFLGAFTFTFVHILGIDLEIANEHSFTLWNFFIYFPAKYILTFQMSYMLSIYCSLVYVICLNLQILNEEILKLQQTKDTAIINNIISKDAVEVWKTDKARQPRNALVLKKIIFLWKAYINICDCCYIVNHYFSNKILVIIAMTFINVLFNTFFILSYIFKLLAKSEVTGEADLIFIISQGFFHTINLIIIIYGCNFCEKLVS